METTGSKLTNMQDSELVHLALEQNQAAFIVLYTRYHIGVKSHISRYVSQKEDIDTEVSAFGGAEMWLEGRHS